ncbi:MAG: hypothetical protein AB2A00_30140 [Myxococcota bacterium]
MVFRMRAQALAMMAGLAAAVGCGMNVGDIDRTQPDKVAKSYFTDGKPWYFRQTIIDIPATSAISFIGEQGETTKVVWKIDRDFLYAFRAHEHLKGGEEYAARPGVPYEGTPIAAFPIESHFDIQREYNPRTGEQTNVISENTVDRPWNEREYMRVDWTQNLITDFRFSGSYVMQQPGGRYVREAENSKDAAKITPDYVDVVHEIIAAPEINAWLSDYYGMPIPSCWLYSTIYADCMGSRLKVRSSFLKADPDRGYDALTYDDNKFAKFGYFRVDRYGYDRHYDIVDTSVDYLIERFNLWKHKPGETCRDDSLEHPYANCANEQIRPIVYYINEDFPDRLKNGAARIGAEWNDVFKDAVSAMTGRSKDSLPDVFVVCLNNPVREGDRPECGAPGTNPQAGDLRYNMIYIVNGPQEASPLGYGPHAVDITTGEVISANAFFYGAALETYVQYALDMIKVQNGELDASDFVNGGQISQHYQRARAMRESSEMSMQPEQFRQLAENLGIPQKAAVLRERLARGELMTDEIPGRLERIRGTTMEGVFFPEPMRRAMAPQFENASDTPPSWQRFLSPATMHDPVFMNLHKDREYRLGRATIDMMEFFDDGMQGLAHRMDCKNLRPNESGDDARDFGLFCTPEGTLDEEKAYNWLLEEIFVGVELHEVGHNVGLRHNFAGTTDAINYFPQYWELRGNTVGANGKLKPEFMLNAQEREGLKDALNKGLREFQYSTIMDYGSKPNSDIHGLGLYDRAAIKYGYGLMVEVFDSNAGNDAPQIQRRDAPLLAPIVRHYTTYPDIIAGDPSYTYDAKVNAIYTRKTVREADVMASSTLVEVPYRFCSDEYVNSSFFCYRFDQGADAYEQVRNNAAMYENYYIFNGLRRNRVGFGMSLYNYISRIYGRYFEFLSAQNKHFLNDNLINRFWDAGCDDPSAGGVHFVDARCGLDRFAGALESANALGRVLQTPEPGCYIRRKPGCYLDSNEDVNGLPATIQKLDDSVCANPPANPGGTLTTVLATDPYTHIEDSESCDSWLPQLTAGGDDIWEKPVDVPLGIGRYGLDKYDREQYGYYFYWKPVAIGSWWDKWLAMQALGDPYTEFIGVDATGDSRSYLISFNSLFFNQIQSAVGGFINEDYNQYAPYVEVADGQANLRYRELVPTFSGALQGQPPREQPAGTITLNPDDQYMARLQAMFIGSVYYTQITEDQDFNQSMFIGKAGSTVDISVPQAIRDAGRYVEFTDPTTGYIYYAVKMQPSDSWFLAERPFYSIGYEYIRKIKDKYFQADGVTIKPGQESALRQDVRIIEIMRGLLAEYGYDQADGFAW